MKSNCIYTGVNARERWDNCIGVADKQYDDDNVQNIDKEAIFPSPNSVIETARQSVGCGLKVEKHSFHGKKKL